MSCDKNLRDFFLELLCSPLTGVFGQNPRLRGSTNAIYCFVIQMGDEMEHVAIVGRQKNLAPWLKERVEPRPVIGNDRGPAGRGLEEPNRRRISGEHHVAARDIQGKA
jgi:hypothetical protein